MDKEANLRIVEEEWEQALPSLQDFVRIPNLTVGSDPEWQSNGLLDKATTHVADWVRAQDVPGCQVEEMKDEGFSPFLYVEIPGTPGDPKENITFLMYGHMDKQPHGPGWDPDISPTSGMIKDGKVWGRGSADDGYAVYGCVIAVKALQKQGISHPRMVIIGETSEESGSPHLGHYVEKLAGRLGKPTAVFCLDSSAEDYGTLWMTTSLRGVVMGNLKVSLLQAGMHSGFGGGVVPDAFLVAMQLLTRVQDPVNGRILLDELHTKIPVERQEQMKDLAETVGRPDRAFKWVGEAQALQGDDAYQMYVDNWWRPCMTVVGCEGLPEPRRAANVLHPYVKLALSFRIPPLVDHNVAASAIKKAFERDPPYGATVTAEFGGGHEASGWNAPEVSANLEAAMSEACGAYFDGRKIGYTGVGGTIPLMNMLGQMFPEATLLVTGVLGPGTNMHGPNENLPIEYLKKVTACVSHVMGVLKPEESSWPEGVPVPEGGARSRAPKKKRFFCFKMPNVPIGQCPCCI